MMAAQETPDEQFSISAASSMVPEGRVVRSAKVAMEILRFDEEAGMPGYEEGRTPHRPCPSQTITSITLS
jgi:hypothetical protein